MNRNKSSLSYNTDPQNQISNEGAHGKYFHQMLNLYDDELDPYEYRLLGHYIRVCGAHGGECWQGLRRISEITRMSKDKIAKTQDSLVARGFIRLEKGNHKDTTRVTIIDRMADNISRYASPEGVRHTDTGVRHTDTGVRHTDTGVRHTDTGVRHTDGRITLEEKLLRIGVEEEAAGAASDTNTNPPISFKERLKAANLIGGD